MREKGECSEKLVRESGKSRKRESRVRSRKKEKGRVQVESELDLESGEKVERKV